MSAPAYGPRLASPDRFVTVVGRPATIALKYRGPGKVIAKTGNVMYTLTSGLIAFFPPDVAREIDSLGLGDQEPFTVCHHGSHFWDVQRAAAPQVLPPPTPAPIEPPQVVAPVSLPPSTTPPSPIRVNGQGQTAADLYVDCFRDAVIIALAAVELAKAKGLLIAPAFEDVRCLATALHIAETRR